MSSISGSCLCEKVQYKVFHKPISKGICYCNQCQKSGGAYGSPLLVLHKDQFQCSQVDLGKVMTTSDRGSTVTRNFCKSCGTHVFSQISDVPDFLTVKAVTMDNFNLFEADYLVWTESAVNAGPFPAGVALYPQSAPLEVLLGVN
jgi:hypothetical protein